ncbi:hypothetical protein Apa02nite_037200 [Actinoplanes palleronii]|uniref:Uncharacterized protein n=1 Tax=Actinoplanes palleronii TaxID=113570 RepID=A0ABQ4BA76_9ACTN|nr:hypothetical protein Apa02nite_037200 [Actinoplanes palleronii]
MARLAGYGVVLVPYGQYTFARSDAAPHAVLVTNWREDGPATALVDPADPQSAPGIVDVAPGPDQPFWSIQTGVFEVAWPSGFTVESTFVPYGLAGKHDSSISVQGPARVPDPDVLIGVGQTVTDRRTMGDGVQVIEVTYEHEGDPWWQAHYLLPRQEGRVLVFTAQSREPGIAAAREGLEWMLALD